MISESDHLETQCAYGEFDKIVVDKKKTVAARKYNTNEVRNHLVPNPTNSKLIELKKFQKIIPYFAPLQ